MTPADTLAEIEKLFARATAGSPKTRPAMLEQALTAGVPIEIVNEVERLLAVDDGADELLRQMASDGANRFLSSIALPQPADHIGPYRMIRELGMGGMGCVYLASRDDGQFEHEVALKLVSRDAWHQDLLERFQRERQILARLSHPNIAALYDGGAEQDFLYFAMEPVDGMPIDSYCDRRRLKLRQRLRLFLQVCAGVGYAHRQLVIHCDLKPSNILVDGNGQVKLLDFGIARLLSEPSRPASEPSDSGPLSPRFASPEQIRGEQLTTQTDVYSLGVLLFRLLCGQWPQAVDPPRPPSESLQGADDSAAAADRRACSYRGLLRQLRGDLDAISLAALERDREARYPSIEQLADDLERTLDGYPVSVHSDSPAYRAARFVGRHRPGLAGLAVVIVALVAALVVVEIQAQRVTRERDRATQVADSLVDLFEIADRAELDGGEITARELLDRGTARVRELTDDADRTALMGTLAELYGRLGLYAESAELYEGSLAAAGPDDHPERTLERARVHFELGKSLALSGRFTTAERHLRQAYELRREELSDDDLRLVRSLNALGLVHHDLGRFAPAEEIYRQSLAMDRRLGDGQLSVHGYTVRTNLALLLIDLGDYRQAIDMISKDIAEMADDDAIDDLERARFAWFRGLAHERANELERAESDMRFVAGIYRLAFGAEHPETASAQSRLAAVLALAGRAEEARPWITAALETRRDTLGSSHPLYAVSLEDSALLEVAAGELEAAANTLEAALAIYAQTMTDYPFASRAMVDLGRVRFALDQPAAAVEVLRRALRLRRHLLPSGNWQIREIEELIAGSAAARPGGAVR